MYIYRYSVQQTQKAKFKRSRFFRRLFFLLKAIYIFPYYPRLQTKYKNNRIDIIDNALPEFPLPRPLRVFIR